MMSYPRHIYIKRYFKSCTQVISMYSHVEYHMFFQIEFFFIFYCFRGLKFFLFHIDKGLGLINRALSFFSFFYSIFERV